MLKAHKIFLTGGGTGGSVTPMLAVADEFKLKTKPGEYNFLWIGTKQGIEAEMVKKAGLAFKSIQSGKLRRYFAWQNLLDPFLILIGFFQSLYLIAKFRPSLIMSAGGFVSVPVVWAGWLLRIPIIIHQQDIRPGLANKLMSPFAKLITVTFEKSLGDYPKKSIWLGNPVRQSFLSRGQNHFKTGPKPVLLVLGGGTGSEAINQLVWQSLAELLRFCQVIHLTGKQKSSNQTLENHSGYQQSEFFNLTEMTEAYAKASLVVSRCGMSVLTELSTLAKPAILIPLPDSHQEDNARLFKTANGAIVLDQKKLSPSVFVELVKQSINNQKLLNELSLNISKIIRPGANTELLSLIKQLLD